MKLFNKSNQSGRSMVEMLGVLAIIGVLSVGAIAGYSKAMMKYKLNKQAEQLNFILNGVYQYLGAIYDSTLNSIVVTSTFAKLGVIPEEMVQKDGTYRDVFGNKIEITILQSLNKTTHFGIEIANSNNMEICQNIFNIAKEHNSIITSFIVYTPDYQYWVGERFSNPTADTKYLADMTVSDIMDFCSTIKPGQSWSAAIKIDP